MDNDLTDPIYCHKCKKRTNNIDAEKIQTANGRWRIAAKCAKCKTNKSKFIKNPNGEKAPIRAIFDWAIEGKVPLKKKFLSLKNYISQ